jgi:hypothetical protein
VLAYFEALFQGPHVVTATDPESHDSGPPFSPSPQQPFSCRPPLPIPSTTP